MGRLPAEEAPGHPLDILHVLWQGTGGGAERQVLDLAEGLQEKGLRTGILYLSSDTGAATGLDRLRIAHRSCSLASGSDPRGPIRVASALRAFRPRLVHDHVSTPWLRALLPVCRDRTIVATEHGHLLRQIYVREAPRLWIERIGAHRTDLFIAPSRAIAEAVGAHYRYSTGRIRIIPHGIRSSVSTLPPATREDVRREMAIGGGDVAVLFVGRLDATKGILDLWEAFSGLAATDRSPGRGRSPGTPGARPPVAADPGAAGRFASPSSLDRGRLVLLIAGTGELEGDLKRRVAQSGLGERVRLLGFRPDVGRLLTASDIFVLPARHEAFGIVLLEAMSAGVPIVATRTGGIPEIVLEGKTGILAEPDDPSGLARALLELADDPGKRQALGRAGRERWAQSFTLDRSVDATLEAYRWAWNRKG
jgi:glycosyltransferase involved in cell wall biosynthesis